MELILRIFLVLFFIGLNAFFVASEFALVAARKTKIEMSARNGSAKSKQVLLALNNLDLYISSTQLGITIASLALGWIGEPTIAHMLEPLFSFLPTTFALISAHTLAIIVGFSLITVLHIVLGELAPKTIALQSAEKTSRLIIVPLVIFTRIFSPVIHALNAIGNWVVRILGFTISSGEKPHSEEEIKLILSQSAASGIIEKEEAEMVYSVFQFGDIPVKEIMVPSKEVLTFKTSLKLAEVAQEIKDHPHSRFPVYTTSVKNITGFIHVKDLYLALLKYGDEKKLADCSIIRKIIYASEKTRIDDLLREMRRKRVHIAAVTNKSNKTTGIVTMEDVIESLVGEIEDEFENS